METTCNLDFEVWAREWLRRRAPLVKASTYADYHNVIVNHLEPYWRGRTLLEITGASVQEFLNHLLRHGRLDGKGGLKSNPARDILSVLRNIVREAVSHGLLAMPEMRLRFPHRCQELRPKVLEPSQQRRLVEAVLADGRPACLGILVALYAGLRIGEVCALRWGDISLGLSLLQVRQTLQRVYLKGGGPSQVVIGPPKSSTSIRVVPISSHLKAALASLPSASPEAYLLTGGARCLEVRSYREFFTRFLRRHGLPVIHFHALRHTFATRCIEAGADPKTVSELLGHSTVAITLNLYVHPNLAQKRSCVEHMATPESGPPVSVPPQSRPKA